MIRDEVRLMRVMHWSYADYVSCPWLHREVLIEDLKEEAREMERQKHRASVRRR